MALSGVTLELKVTFDGSEDVEAKLHQVIIRAIDLAMRDTIAYMQDIVPESQAAFFRYPISYQSEQLLNTAVTALRAHVRELSRSQLRDDYVVPVEFPASYAEHVNEVKTSGTAQEITYTRRYKSGKTKTFTKWTKGWSKTGSESKFFEKTVAFFKQRYCYHQKVILGVQAVMEQNIDRIYHEHVKGGV